MNKPLTVILTGPTATGKTDLSLDLAHYLHSPIISADARQCYKYLDIGTAKPSEQTLARIPHYFISELTPDQTATAAYFAEKTNHWRFGLLPECKGLLVVGGSTLYIESLIRPLDDLPPKNEQNIQNLESMTRDYGLNYVYEYLQSVDPEYVKTMDGQNPHRIYRALDVWMQTGKPFSSLHKNHPLVVPEKTLVICLYRDRTELHERINDRVDQMFRDGLLDEVKSVLEMGYHPELPALRTVGYRECISYLQNQLSIMEAKEKIKTNTRRYARRQLTWFRRWSGVKWIYQTGRSSQSVKKEAINHIKQLADHS